MNGSAKPWHTGRAAALAWRCYGPGPGINDRPGATDYGRRGPPTGRKSADFMRLHCADRGPACRKSRRNEVRSTREPSVRCLQPPNDAADDRHKPAVAGTPENSEVVPQTVDGRLIDKSGGPQSGSRDPACRPTSPLVRACTRTWPSSNARRLPGCTSPSPIRNSVPRR